MKKIPTLFARDHATKLVTPELSPGCEWAFTAAMPYRKWDGSAAMIRDSKLFKRYDAKAGKTPPDGFEAVQEPDEVTGHLPGWLPVGDGPEDRWFREAMAVSAINEDDGEFLCSGDRPDGTYELCGPKIQGNPEGLSAQLLIPHTIMPLSGIPTTFDRLREALVDLDYEGIVWHGIDGRMCKLKLRDFGLKRRGKGR